MPEEKTVKKSAVAKRLRRRNLLLGFTGVVLTVVICLFTPLFAVSEITVTGNEVLSADEVIAASGIKKGDNMLRINSRKAEEKINRLGYVENVEIKRKFLARIKIEITEANEVAFLAFAGNNVGVTRDLKVTSIIKGKDFKSSKPVISGYPVKKVEKGETVVPKKESKEKLLKSLMTALEENKLMSKLKKIDVSDTDNMTVTLNTDTRIILGDDTQLSYKLKCVNAVLGELGEIRAGKINASDPANVIYEGGN
ncbi:MAG: FtsQ-type POTRA domain-containing protein [Clostridia bacterium]|nr:FtsQ-type POTRA domain-containing protein [Clostridia bacterium]